MAGLRIRNFALFCSERENKVLENLLGYLESLEVENEIGVYTATPRFGVIMDRSREIMLLSDKIFPETFDPKEPISRFLAFTFLHECAHINGIGLNSFKDYKAHDKAKEWFDKYIAANNIGISEFGENERERMHDLITARDYIFVSSEGDENDYFSIKIGEPRVKALSQKCKDKGGVTAVFRRFVMQLCDEKA